MKDIKTISLLYEHIEKEYSWRISELSNFKNSVLLSRDKAQDGMIRAGITLLYAHWEGFIKNIADFYYQFVSNQDYVIEELSDCFVSIILRSELEILAGSKKITQHNKIIKTIFEEQSKKAIFSSKSPIKTSNLKYDIFEDVCIMIGIEIEEFRSHYKNSDFDRDIELTINEDLVKNRNIIAHGQYVPISLKEYKDLYNVVVNGFLYVFKEQVMSAAQNKKYLRSNNFKI